MTRPAPCPTAMHRLTRIHNLRQLMAVITLCAIASCASIEFERNTQTSGVFVATGVSMTVLKIDIPKSASQIARENLSDANLANMRIEDSSVVPDLGPFNWILDIFSVRVARISGRWGFEGEGAR